MILRRCLIGVGIFLGVWLIGSMKWNSFTPAMDPGSFFGGVLFAGVYLFRQLAPTQHGYLSAFVAFTLALMFHFSANRSPLSEGWGAYANLCAAAAVLIIAGKVGWDMGYKEGYRGGVVDALDPKARIPEEHIEAVRQVLNRRRGEDDKGGSQ
jgi:hypothetical protein